MRLVSSCKFPFYREYSTIFRPLKSATFTWPWKHCAMSSVHGAMLPALLARHAISQTRFWRTAVRSRVPPDWRSHTISTTYFQPSVCRCYCSNTSFEWLTEPRGFALATCYVTVNAPKYIHAQFVKTFHVYTRLHVRAVRCPGAMSRIEPGGQKHLTLYRNAKLGGPTEYTCCT